MNFLFLSLAGFSIKKYDITFKLHPNEYHMLNSYDKLNYLSSVMAPNYSNVGWMRGNIIKLTIGDYLNDVYGALQNISFNIPEESPWDIGRSFEGEESKLDT